jgi:hypothetical protein
VSEHLPELGGLRSPGQPLGAGLAPTAPRELFVRHARRDGRAVAVLRAVDHGTTCIVEAEVFRTGPAGMAGGAVSPGPYTFATAHEATAFVTEAVEALMHLGCDISAD